MSVCDRRLQLQRQERNVREWEFLFWSSSFDLTRVELRLIVFRLQLKFRESTGEVGE